MITTIWILYVWCDCCECENNKWKKRKKKKRSKNHVEFTFSKLNVIFGFATKEKISNVCNFIVLMAK